MRKRLVCLEEKKHNKVAFIREGGIGDILMTIPVLKVLSRLSKDIDYFTSPKYFLLLKEAECNVRAIQGFDRKRNQYSKIYDLRNQLEDYSLPLNRQHRMDAIAEFCKIKLNGNLTPLLTRESGWAKQWLRNQKHTLIGICVRSAFRLRSWVETGPRALIELLPPNINYILFGTNDWYSWKHPRVQMATDLTLEQVISLIGECSAIVTTDNGLLHVAGSLGVPIVALFGSLPPEIRVKYYKNVTTIVPDNVPCSFCWEWQVGSAIDLNYCRDVDTRCMRAIKPWMVANNLLTLLAKTKELRH